MAYGIGQRLLDMASQPLFGPRVPTRREIQEERETGAVRAALVQEAVEKRGTPQRPQAVGEALAQTSGAQETMTKQREMSPVTRKALQDYEAGVQQENEAIRMAAESGRAQAKAQVAGENEKLRISSNYISQIEGIKEKHKLDAANEIDAIDRKIANLNNMDYKGFWHNKGTGTKIQAAIAIMLGAIGSGLTGGKGNRGLQAVQKSMDDDFRDFKSKVDSKVKAINASRMSLEAKERARRKELSDLDAYRIAQLDRVNSEIAKMAGESKIPEIKANAERAIAANEQQKALKLAEMGEKYSKEKTKKDQQVLAKVKIDKDGNVVRGDQETDDGRPHTEAQMKAASNLEAQTQAVMRMEERERLNPRLLEQVRDYIAQVEEGVNKLGEGWATRPFLDAVSALGANIPGLKLETLPPDVQMYINDGLDIVNIKMRKDSGSQVSVSEFIKGNKTYLPQPGGTPELAEQKKQKRRELLLENRNFVGWKQSFKFDFE